MKGIQQLSCTTIVANVSDNERSNQRQNSRNRRHKVGRTQRQVASAKMSEMSTKTKKCCLKARHVLSWDHVDSQIRSAHTSASQRTVNWRDLLIYFMRMTLNDLQCHSPIAGSFKYNSTTIYTAFATSSNDSTQRVARATVTVGLVVKYMATVMASERRRREPSAEKQL